MAAPATTALPTTTTGLGGTTSTTEQGLDYTKFHAGDCLTWDQTSTSAVIPAATIPCDQPHLVEMVSTHRVPDRLTTYPDNWGPIFSEVCATDTDAYLQRPLDPHGLFYATGLHPSRAGWALNDRGLMCGIGRYATTVEEFAHSSREILAFSGPVVGQSQDLLFAIGTCFTNAPFKPVLCTVTHDLEVTGTVDLTGRVDAVPAREDSLSWQQIIGGDCGNDALAYLGRFPDQGLRAGWIPLEPASFAAGRRTVQCTLSRWQGDTGIPLDGPLRGVAA